MMTNCYYFIALAAITVTHAFSSIFITRRKTLRHHQRQFLILGKCAARNDDASPDGKSNNIDSIFEQVLRIQMPWDVWLNSNSLSSPASMSMRADKKSSSLVSSSSSSWSAREVDVQRNTNFTLHASNSRLRQSNNERQSKLGILLIDHGSKREASNKHLHFIAQSYYQMKWDVSASTNNYISADEVIVRAAHMEIATPSIETQLRKLIVHDKVTHAICVPYFLSPGKHATIDVPNLIDEAWELLDSEGLLEYDDGNKRVEIRTTKSVGSNTERMIEVVDELVRVALNDDTGGKSLPLNNIDIRENLGKTTAGHEQSSGLNNSSVSIAVTAELQKYSNRAAILENVLRLNTKRMKSMRNRTILMENALKQIQIRTRKEREESCKTSNQQVKAFTEQIANLTSKIEEITHEKNSWMQSSEHRRINMERDYNATISDLRAKIIVLEQKLTRHEGERKREDLQPEMQKSYQEQLEQIKELQLQLGDLLDAYAHLDQLHNNTERALNESHAELRKLRMDFETALQTEKEEKEKIRTNWINAQREKDIDGAKFEKTLNETTTRYEALLDEERDKAYEWKGKWESIQYSMSAFGEHTIDDQSPTLASFDKKLKDAVKFEADAIEKIKALESELMNQKEQYESSSARKDEQQLQLQKYLRAQLSTYYETIQTQIAQIAKYEEDSANSQRQFNESMLIASKSVEASHRREEHLLTNIEELERELFKARESIELHLTEYNDLQVRLQKMEDLQASNDALMIRNDELTMKIEQLEGRISEVQYEKDQADDVNATARESRYKRLLSSHPQRQIFRWVRKVFRPFSLFRRR